MRGCTLTSPILSETPSGTDCLKSRSSEKVDEETAKQKARAMKAAALAIKI